MSRLWQTLETFPGPAAVPAVWKAGLGDEFDIFRSAFLRTRPKPAMSYPCPRDCGCAHEIVRHKGGPIVAVCQCEPCCCNDIRLAESDCVILELSWQKLGRAICTAFGFAQREAALAVPNAIQIGASGSESIPVMLTIPNDRDVFGQTLTALAATLRRRFILVAPTADFMDAPLQQILADLDALFVPLDTAVRFTATGLLEPTRMIAGSAERKINASHKHRIGHYLIGGKFKVAGDFSKVTTLDNKVPVWGLQPFTQMVMKILLTECGGGGLTSAVIYDRAKAAYEQVHPESRECANGMEVIPKFSSLLFFFKVQRRGIKKTHPLYKELSMAGRKPAYYSWRSAVVEQKEKAAQ